jgi:hypothetical protein
MRVIAAERQCGKMLLRMFGVEEYSEDGRQRFPLKERPYSSQRQSSSCFRSLAML